MDDKEERDLLDSSPSNTDNTSEFLNSNVSNNKVSDKFLVTRSKRKYKKRDLKVESDKRSVSSSKKSKDLDLPKMGDSDKINKGKAKSKVDKGDDLDKRVENAKSYLQELNELISKRNLEIDNLKNKAAAQKAQQSVSEINRQIETVTEVPSMVNIAECKQTSTGSDDNNNISDEDEGECEDVSRFLNLDDSPEDRKSRKRSRSRHRSGERGNKSRRKSKSKSKSRSRSRQRGRKRNREEHEDLESHYRSDPLVQEIVKKMVSEQIAAAKAKGGMNTEKLKSPSDSTLYTPAINRVMKPIGCTYQPIVDRYPIDKEVSEIESSDCGQFKLQANKEPGNGQGHTDFIDSSRINDMITQLRLGTGAMKDDVRTKEGTSTSTASDEAKNKRTPAQEAILDAERFKAQVQQPTNKGIQFNNTDNLMCLQQQSVVKHLRYLDSEDDEFFHTICHIDPQIKEKIERGGFVDLDKLIQKKTQYEPSEKRMQLVNRDGQSYFVPYERETKVDGIRKWEQAFRVYTTIYCQANPTRSGEILQYVDVIHRAASIFSWDNVAKYDYVFRQLMAEKPHRSWAKTYTQMWNITLNEPIKKIPRKWKQKQQP